MSTILTRVLFTVVNGRVTQSAHPATLTHTVEVIDQLYTVQGAVGAARARKTLIDISLTALAHIAWGQWHSKCPTRSHTGASVVAGTLIAVIVILLTEHPSSAMWARTAEASNQVMARPTISTGLWCSTHLCLFHSLCLENQQHIRTHIFQSCLHRWHRSCRGLKHTHWFLSGSNCHRSQVCIGTCAMYQYLGRYHHVDTVCWQIHLRDEATNTENNEHFSDPTEKQRPL